MRQSFAALAVFALICTRAILAADLGTVLGAVMDPSGGLLPGVTVTATAPDGRVLALTVTDAAGEYALPNLPTGIASIGFDLSGFAPQTVTLRVSPGAQTQLVERLELATISEVVEVRGVEPPDPPAPPPPPQRTPPVVVPVLVQDRDTVCGPSKPSGQPEALGIIASGRDTGALLYATGAEVAIQGGRDTGLSVGRNLVARRLYRVSGDPSADALREHSAGLVQIVEVDAHTSFAVVMYACDEMRQGDFLVAFDQGPAGDQSGPRAPDYSAAARILFADDGQVLGAPRRLMVVARGTRQGAFVGQRLTLFRRRADTAQPLTVGDAVVVAVRNDSSTIRIESVTDVVSAGDWAAPLRASAFARAVN